MKLRRLTDAGIDSFRKYLTDLAADPGLAVPKELLTDPVQSEPLATTAEVEARTFGTRLAAGQYLHALLGSAGIPGIDRDRGVWTWLTLFYFDELCPMDGNGKRKAGAQARYVAELTDWKRFYRHLLAGPFFIYKAHFDDPARATAVLLTAVAAPGEVVEQIASRHELVTNRTIMTVITRLYVDDAGKFRRGASGSGGGSARRLAIVLGQFELTFDLYSIGAEGLLGLLPREFQRFT